MSFASFAAAFQRVADSMTMYGRSLGDTSQSNNSLPVVGEVWATSTCVRVQWAWLIYPAALIVLLVVFLVAAVWSLRVGGELVRQDYKTSVLPLMFHTVERQGGAAAAGGYMAMRGGGVETREEIDREAKLRVVLGRTEGGWRFKEI